MQPISTLPALNPLPLRPGPREPLRPRLVAAPGDHFISGLALGPSPLPAALPLFAPPGSLPDLSAAREWLPGSPGLSGTQANRIVTGTYQSLDSAFAAYLGPPALSHWATFGKFASREVGGQIQDLETTLTALRTFRRFDGNPINDIQAARVVIGLAAQDGQFRRGLIMAANAAGIRVGDGVSARELVQALRRCPLDHFRAFTSLLGTMRQALVNGNTRVYGDIAGAYHLFLEAEAQGQDGLQALKRAGYAAAPPEGFLVAAFARYRAARRLGQLAAAADGPRREALLAGRSRLVFEANLLAGIQEQMCILQAKDIFGHPEVHRLLGDSTRSMRLALPGRSFAMLPDGGNWADFAARMGLQEVPADRPGAIPVRDQEGQVRSYAPLPASQRRGSIYQLFADYHGGDNSRRLRENQPRPL